VQQSSFEQSSTFEKLNVEAGFEALFVQQLSPKQSPSLSSEASAAFSPSIGLPQHSSALATVNSLVGFEILLLQQPFFEQSSPFDDATIRTGSEFTLQQSPLPQLLLGDSSFFDDVTSGTILVATFGESSLQQLIWEQLSVCLVSIGATDLHKVRLLESLGASFEAPESLDAVDRFERSDA
jgi:hypothetical protein